MKKYLIILLFIVLSGCNYLRQDVTLPKYNLPEKMDQNLDDDLIADWWDKFNDPVLSELIKEAKENNADLEAALARVENAEALVKEARSGYLPSIGLDANAAGGDDAYTGRTDTATLGVNASWEVDLWGRIRNSNKLAKANLLAEKYNKDGLELSIYSSVAESYFQLRALESLLKLNNAIIKNLQDSYNLQLKRFNGGLIPDTDLQQAGIELLNAKAENPSILNKIYNEEKILELLIGATPKQIIENGLEQGVSLEKVVVPPKLPINLPSDILLRRPDIVEAEQELLMNRANIAVARAAYFPTVSISGLAGVASISSLFTNSQFVWSYLGDVSMPLFNSGLTAAQVAQAKAQEREAVAYYKKAISTAFVEVKTASLLNLAVEEKLTAVNNQINALNKQYKSSLNRYNNGLIDYIDLMDTQRALFKAEQTKVLSEGDMLTSYVEIYKSLGGGWKVPVTDELSKQNQPEDNNQDKDKQK